MTRPAELAWRGSVRMALGWGLFKGRAGDNQPHAHHAIQILLAESPQCFWTVSQGWCLASGAVIGPDVRHQLAPTTQAVTLLYIEPDSSTGQTLRARLANEVVELGPSETAALLHQLSSEASSPEICAAQMLLARPQPARGNTQDELILRAIEQMPARLPARYTAQALAAGCQLSLSRFQHRFRAHTGMAWRPYLRWRRMLAAMQEVMQGASLTDAAYSAGFSDAAHFTRTMRRHFGITPGMLRLSWARAC